MARSGPAVLVRSVNMLNTRSFHALHTRRYASGEVPVSKKIRINTYRYRMVRRRIERESVRAAISYLTRDHSAIDLTIHRQIDPLRLRRVCFGVLQTSEPTNK